MLRQKYQRLGKTFVNMCH